MKEPIKMLISERIKEIRSEKKLSQTAFGELFMVSQDTVSLWEKGKSYPSAEQIYCICKEFGISADYFLGLSDY